MASRKAKTAEASGASVPAYIVTFSDMVTLLLTFFVMLLSMAQVQDPELFNKSRDAFNESINCYGLGILMGKQISPEFNEKMMKYFIEEPDSQQTKRTIDSREETLRRLFNQVAKSMNTTPSRINVRLSDYVPTGIYFERGQTDLDTADRQYLDRMALEFPQQADPGLRLYVLGLASEESTEQRQWSVSSTRAQRVAEYLAQIGFECPVYAWGIGPGGLWIDHDSPVSRQSHIFLAFVQNDN